MAVPSPSLNEILQGSAEYSKREKRDAMYKVATFLVSHFWGNAAEMANGLGVMLLTWNQACYRYGQFDFDELEQCIARNLEVLSGFRNRDLPSFTQTDETLVQGLFLDFLDALAAVTKSGQRKSPVAVAKALHVLAPTFFPIWDATIAYRYDCYYGSQPEKMYVRFMGIMQRIVAQTSSLQLPAGKTALKLVDEYNYAKFTKEWV